MSTNAPATTQQRSWLAAYRAFLASRDESLILKLAPVLLIVGSPEVVASNLIPFVGEFADIGAFTLTVLVIIRTWMATRKYR